eukprot:1071227-Lingulodinium_polyedra.AAC.1
MAAWGRRAAGLQEALRLEGPLGPCIEEFFSLVLAAGGPLGRSLRRGLAAPAAARDTKRADRSVFPVPLLSVRLPARGRG